MSGDTPTISEAILEAASTVAGLQFTTTELQSMLAGVQAYLHSYAQVRGVALPNEVPPAIQFNPQLPSVAPALTHALVPARDLSVTRPSEPSDLAFGSVATLSALIRSRQVSALELTELSLQRLERYDPQLQCVITLTAELALEQAKRADAELAAGRWRGPLHGLPWGAKDLLDTKGIRTTWGAAPYTERVPSHDATVVTRLAEAGAVLTAKLSLGELAMDDQWFGGHTKNPWNLEQGSSGSSAGSASAVAAGLVSFAIGSETWGSIVSPSTRCRVTGLRPTFGRVSRHGAMALSWSMDKLGPLARSAEDCALVFAAIYGPDGLDLTVADQPFAWEPQLDWANLRIGYLPNDAQLSGEQQFVLEVLRERGATLVPIQLPEYPLEAMGTILFVEAAAAFDALTRSDADDLLVRQHDEAWPNLLRQARLIPAVEYVQANRLRTLTMQAFDETMRSVDCYVCGDMSDLLLTNLTGHPSVTVPTGVDAQGDSRSVTFTGRLYDEATILAVAKAFQEMTSFHSGRPALAV